MITEQYRGKEAHNCELLDIIMAQERDGYIKLCNIVKGYGQQYTTRLEQMNSLLKESDRV